MTWLATDRPDAVHVLPLEDLIIHVPSPSCTCAPRIENHGATNCCSGTLYVRQVVVHAAMDGRD